MTHKTVYPCNRLLPIGWVEGVPLAEADEGGVSGWADKSLHLPLKSSVELDGYEQ